MNSIGVNLAIYHNLGLLRFSLPKIGGMYIFLVSTSIFSVLYLNFEFCQILFFSVSKVISCRLMALIAVLKHCQHRRECFRPQKQRRRILTLNLFHDWPVQFSVCHSDYRWSQNNVVPSKDLNDLSQLVLTTFHRVFLLPYFFAFFQFLPVIF